MAHQKWTESDLRKTQINVDKHDKRIENRQQSFNCAHKIAHCNLNVIGEAD